MNVTRAAVAAQDSEACAALASEAGELRKVLVRQLGALSAAGGSELPVLRDHLWLSQADITRSSQTLGPMLKKARKELEKLLEVRVPASCLPTHLCALFDRIGLGERLTPPPNPFAQSAGPYPVTQGYTKSLSCSRREKDADAERTAGAVLGRRRL